MKNIQIVDSAVNAAFSIYTIPDDIFHQLFSEEGQNVEFIEDVVQRLGENHAGKLMKYTWNSRVEKSLVQGIHGTLFFGMKNKKCFYPNKRESDLENAEIQKGINKEGIR